MKQIDFFFFFRAPSFVVDGEMFWGNDRLEEALEWAMATHRLQARQKVIEL